MDAPTTRTDVLTELRHGRRESLGGLTEKEIAEALGITGRSVQRDWAKARMMLRRALES